MGCGFILSRAFADWCIVLSRKLVVSCQLGNGLSNALLLLSMLMLMNSCVISRTILKKALDGIFLFRLRLDYGNFFHFSPQVIYLLHPPLWFFIHF